MLISNFTNFFRKFFAFGVGGGLTVFFIQFGLGLQSDPGAWLSALQAAFEMAWLGVIVGAGSGAVAHSLALKNNEVEAKAVSMLAEPTEPKFDWSIFFQRVRTIVLGTFMTTFFAALYEQVAAGVEWRAAASNALGFALMTGLASLVAGTAYDYDKFAEARAAFRSSRSH